ncbi:MAG TPA: DUF3887 domain-containing protein [Candidatus Binatia bacterium]|nr:DUF3887 domain-containing protein [Candidatus Binatia bacterium]
MKNKKHSFVTRHWSFVIARALLLALILIFAPKIPAQETNRYTKVADQVVKLVNAGDSSAIEKLFNDAMRQALPLEKATPFFKGLTAQFGKIQKLDAPVRKGGWTVFLAHCERGFLDMSLALDRDDKISGLNFTPRAAPAGAAPGKSADRYTKMANQLVELINTGNYAGVQTNFNKKMDAALPLDKSSTFFSELTQQMGKIQKLGERRFADGAMVFPVKCEKGALDMQLVLDSRGLIAGLNFTPQAGSSDAAPGKHQTELSLPFKGRWLVFWGGDTKELNHHHDIPAQKFAFDLLGVDEKGETHRGDGTKNEDYFCFGREILAPADGVVVEAIDGVRDNTPGSMNPYCLVGNCVVIQHRTNEFSVLAHFQRGSVAVKTGDQVKRGQLLGKCGNSGNSSEPHLHYHLQHSPVFQDALGIKILFQNPSVTKEGQAKTKMNSPVKGDTISPE